MQLITVHILVEDTSWDWCQLQGTPNMHLLDFVSPEVRSHTGLRSFQPKYLGYIYDIIEQMLGVQN